MYREGTTPHIQHAAAVRLHALGIFDSVRLHGVVNHVPDLGAQIKEDRKKSGNRNDEKRKPEADDPLICSRGAIVITQFAKPIAQATKPFPECVYFRNDKIDLPLEPCNFGIGPRFRRGDLGVRQVARIAHMCSRRTPAYGACSSDKSSPLEVTNSAYRMENGM
jgi:hypothetical protein